MSTAPPADRLRLAIDIDDPVLADRVVAALGEVAGVELVSEASEADVVIGAAGVGTRQPEGGIALTPRELEVLTLLAEGASNKEIARRLAITPHTAKFHVGRLLDKLDAVSRTDLVAHAARLGLIEL